MIRIRRKLDRSETRVAPKKPKAVRDRPTAGPGADPQGAPVEVSVPKSGDFVFASATGGPLHYRNVVRRRLEKAIEEADLSAESKLRWHDLRHCFASMLIAEGLDVVYVRQLGHASPTITLGIYAHLFDARSQGDRARSFLEEGFTAVVGG